MQNYPKTLAELKRHLQLGVKLKKVGPGTLNSQGFTIDNTIRTINLVQTNAIRFEPLPEQKGGGSYLEYSKAKDYTFTPEGFTVFNDCDTDNPLKYEYIN